MTLIEALVRRRATVAVAESLTAGLIGATITTESGASAAFVGGVIVYATDLKARLLGVPEALLAERGAVDPDVAEAMAVGVRNLTGATYGLAVTGVAGPDPQDGKPVGTVFAAVAGPADLLVRRDLRLSGTRDEIRISTCQAALDLLRGVLEPKSGEHS